MSLKEKDLENLLNKKNSQISKKEFDSKKQRTKDSLKELNKKKLEEFLKKILEKEKKKSKPLENPVKTFEKTKKLKEVILPKEEPLNSKNNFSSNKKTNIYETSKGRKFYGGKYEENPLSQKKEEENLYENRSSIERLTNQRQEFIQNRKKQNFYSEDEKGILKDYVLSSKEETTSIKFDFETEKKKKLYKEFRP